jgi:hypothetical protein
MFHPTWVDAGIFIGTIGIFFTLYLLFARYFPVLALNEVKSILKSSGESYKNEQQSPSPLIEAWRTRSSTRSTTIQSN